MNSFRDFISYNVTGLRRFGQTIVQCATLPLPKLWRRENSTKGAARLRFFVVLGATVLMRKQFSYIIPYAVFSIDNTLIKLYDYITKEIK